MCCRNDECKTLDLTKPVQTADGRKVEIYSTDNGGEYPVHGRVAQSDGTFSFATWKMDGTFHSSKHNIMNLINVPPEPIVRYFNVYSDYVYAYPYKSRHSADLGAAEYRVACKRVEFVEGEYDD